MNHRARDVGRPGSKLLAWPPCAGGFAGATAHTRAAAVVTAARRLAAWCKRKGFPKVDASMTLHLAAFRSPRRG